MPQKFLFLLFLSGLFTLCFGALFLLPNSSRLKRFFLAPRTQPPGLEGVPEGPGHPLAGEQESPPNPAPAAPAPGEEDPSSLASPRRRKGWARRPQPTRPREEATAARSGSGGGGGRAEAPQEGSLPFSFDFHAFRSRLRHPVLGTRTRGSEEPQSLVQTRREKIKEVRTLLPPQKRKDPLGLPSTSPAVTPGPWSTQDSPRTLCTFLSSQTSHLDSCLLTSPPWGSLNDPYPWQVAAEPLGFPHPQSLVLPVQAPAQVGSTPSCGAASRVWCCFW